MPQCLQRGQIGCGRDLGCQQWRQLDIAYAAGQGLGTLPQQPPRGTAEQEEAARPAVGVDLGPQRGKDVGQVLHFIEHDEAVAVAGEEQLGLGQLGPVGRSLQVEHQGRAPAGRRLGGQGMRQRRLADLARPEQHDAGEVG